MENLRELLERMLFIETCINEGDINTAKEYNEHFHVFDNAEIQLNNVDNKDYKSYWRIKLLYNKLITNFK